MRFLKGHGFEAVALMAALAMPGLAAAQSCNLTNPPCTGGCSNAPCGGSVTVNTATINVCQGFGASAAGQSFNLTATPYQNTCHGNMGLGGPGCGAQAGILPPFRFWTLNNYKTANSGCQDFVAGNGAGNAALDLGGFTTTPPNGYWFLFGADWFNAKTDGCALAAGSGPVVVEVSEPNPANFPAAGSGEGTVNHASWYAVMSVPISGAIYDLDLVTGPADPACPGNKAVPSAPVGGVTVGGRTPGNGPGLCRGDATASKVGTPNANSQFFDVQVSFETASPAWFTEAGPSAAPALIAGYQVLYAKSPEPTSSNYFTGGWQPVLDTADPTRAKGVIPLPAAGPVTITLPVGAPDTYWLATRIVYSDTSLNGTLGTCTVGTDCPLVVSDVSQHCGPIQFGTSPVAVEFGDVAASRTAQGVKVTWTTLMEDDVLGFRIMRATDPAGSDAEALTQQVAARGIPSAYDTTDSAAPAGASWYYVQELTSNGPGTRSQAVRVDPVSTTPSGRAPSVNGGRSRVRR